ncbi:Protein of unknown function [Marinobacter sp. LV10R510-11A]|nr:Protein of unknown function [Marinobacter sp. LV10R510-11A]
MSRFILRKISIIMCIFFISLHVNGDPIFSKSDAENRYQKAFSQEMTSTLLQMGVPEKISKQEGISIDAAERSVQEMVTLSSVCGVLAVRLYDEKYKNFVANAIADGSSVREIQQSSKAFVQGKARSGELDVESFSGTMTEAFNFLEDCLKAAKADPIPTYATRGASPVTQAEGDKTEKGLEKEVSGQGYHFIKSLNDLPMLADFESVKSYDQYLEGYGMWCIEKSKAEISTPNCFVRYEAWDRELNLQYQLLMEVLTKKSKALLRTVQRDWIKSRDSMIDFNSHLLDDKYEVSDMNTFIGVRANEADRAISPVVKERTLQLESWREMVVGGRLYPPPH